MFTVIIPTRGRPAMLARAIDSVLAQRGTGFRLLIADDGTGEGETLARARGLPAFSSGGAGQVAARNQAVAQVATDWLAWLDDDDWWTSPDHLARAAAALDAGAGYWFANGVFVTAGAPDIAFAPRVTSETLTRDNGILVSGLCYPAANHRRLGPFDETLPIYWDWDWSLRVARAGIRLHQETRPSVAIARHAGNLTGEGRDALRRADLDRLAAKHGLGPLVLKTHIDLA